MPSPHAIDARVRAQRDRLSGDRRELVAFPRAQGRAIGETAMRVALLPLK